MSELWGGLVFLCMTGKMLEKKEAENDSLSTEHEYLYQISIRRSKVWAY